MRKNETKWGEKRSANCTANNQPPFRSGGKISLQYVQLALHVLNIATTLYFFSDEQQSTSSSHPPLLNVLSRTLSDQAAVRRLLFAADNNVAVGTQNLTWLGSHLV